ncbi:MAG: class I SAM-dependent methyltransferase [Desulfamplus sp.]|nr:class I SAM-dependent methyltransferase [Desulfamplus sp.]
MVEYFNSKAKDWDKENYRIERAKAVAEEIKNAIIINNSMSVADFGCGTGLLGFHFINIAREVVFIDSSEEMLNQVVQKAKTMNTENYRILAKPEVDHYNKYDLIINLMVFHHINNVEETISQLIGQLKKSSYFAFFDLDSEDGSFHGEDIVPHNGFKREYIRKIFANNSLSIILEKQVFVNKKIIDGKEKNYPVFLMIGKCA